VCGIVGFWNPHGGAQGVMTVTVTAMADRLRHRGPDSSGVWVSPESGVALGHRRLAIVDLSASGHQPMISPTGRFVIVFNGEIYNFVELKRDLEALGCRFRGTSDTEVLLAAIDRWGLEPAVRKCNGMFALAVWDTRERCLHLVRDRFGEKPLYLAVNKRVLFASELKALHAFPGFAPAVSREALCLYLHYSYVPDPLSIYEGVNKLAAGSILTLRRDDLSSEAGDICRKAYAYWSAKETCLVRSAERTSASLAEATQTLDEHLRLSVRQRMTADVPLGAFLSGGLDSSAVVALMQAGSGRQIQTFTVGFDEFGYDESAHAKQIASYLGTSHGGRRRPVRHARDVHEPYRSCYSRHVKQKTSYYMPAYGPAKSPFPASLQILKPKTAAEVLPNVPDMARTMAAWCRWGATATTTPANDIFSPGPRTLPTSEQRRC
jgi:asparagine synthase (glutamine-hydrolysing)